MGNRALLLKGYRSSVGRCSIGRAIALVTCVVGTARAQQLAISPGVANTDGTFVTPLDNPTFSGVSPLVGAESATRGHGSETNSWALVRHELHMLTSCTSGDPFCISAGTRSDDGVLNVWPAFEGQAGATGFPFESHGLRLGAQPATVALEKYDHDANLSRIGNVKVALEAGTIIVPINVVIVRPTERVSPDARSLMSDMVDVPYYQALYDDLWLPNLFRVTEPVGLLNQLSGQWDMRTSSFRREDGVVLSRPNRKHIADFYRPDDIFAQCGIQFRLTSVVAVDDDSARNRWMTEDGTPGGPALCGAGFLLSAIARSWRDAAASSAADVRYGAFNTNATTVILASRINHPDCLEEVEGIGEGTTHLVAIGAENAGGASPEFLLHHELGHALGMDHPSGTCSNNVMCAAGGGWSPHIAGCEKRDGANLANPPFNCVPAPTESTSLASCDIARRTASGIAQSAASPVPMEPSPSGPGSSTASWRGVGGTPISYDSKLFTEGRASLAIGGTGYRSIESAPFRTADWLQVGSKFALDVFVPSGQPNPHWLGSVDLFMTVPGAGLNSTYLGHVELTPLGTGSWSTIHFELTEAARLALLGDYSNATLSIAVNTPTGAPSLRLDNLRADGNASDRTVFHQGPAAGGLSNSLLSFDAATDWFVNNGVGRHDGQRFTAGAGALGVISGGYTEIISRPFSTSELPRVSPTLSIDVFVPSEQPNPYWVGSLQAFATCPSANIYNAYLGQQDLTYLFRDEFNTLTFPALPSAVLTALGSSNVCTIKLALNTPVGAGEYVLDNLAFR